MNKKYIESIVRALIIKEGKILLCENKSSGHFFLPGGHVEFGESFKKALAREIKEELGISGIVEDVVGVLENTFQDEGVSHHEVNVIFIVSLPTAEVISQESHIAFRWIELVDLLGVNLLPQKLPSLLSKWLKDRETFFESTF